MRGFELFFTSPLVGLEEEFSSTLQPVRTVVIRPVPGFKVHAIPESRTLTGPSLSWRVVESHEISHRLRPAVAQHSNLSATEARLLIQVAKRLTDVLFEFV